MNLWLDASYAVTFAATGLLLGHFFSRLRTPYWTFGYDGFREKWRFMGVVVKRKPQV